MNVSPTYTARQPREAQTVSALGLPEALTDYANQRSGLVVVSSGAVRGKSTTLFALAEEINRQRDGETILAAQYAPEFVMEPRKCRVDHVYAVTSQKNRPSLAETVRKTYDRNRARVIVMDEIHNYDELRTAINLGNSGHLVLAAIHASSVKGTLNRLMSAYPRKNWGNHLGPLAEALVGIISQDHRRENLDSDWRVEVEALTVDDSVKAQIHTGRIDYEALAVDPLTSV